MEGRGAQGFKRRLVLRGAVALVAGKAVARVERVLLDHERVPRGLGQHRGGRDAQRLAVALGQRELRAGAVVQGNVVDQQVVGGIDQVVDGALHGQAGGGHDAQLVDLGFRGRPHRPGDGHRLDAALIALALAGGHLLGVAHAVQHLAHALVIGQRHRGGIHRSGPGAAPGFIQPGNDAVALAPQLLFESQVGFDGEHERATAAHGLLFYRSP